MSNYSDSSFSEDENSSWFKAYNYISSKSTVLDIGCSSGNFGEVLINKKSCIVDGIELDAADYKKAKQKLNEVFQLNVETDDLSSIKNQYDFIYFGDVIEHLIFPIPTLKRVKSLLKRNGKIVFSIPNMSHLSVRIMLLEGKFLYGETGLLDKTHLHFYTHSEIQRVFGGAGYIISDLDPVVKDYPKELLDKELSGVGLKLTNKFLKFADSTEASVYQFVGTAETRKNSSQKSKQLDFVSPIDKFQVYLDETKSHYEKTIKDDKKHITKQQIALEDYQAVVERQNRELERLRKHLVVRLTRKIKGHRKS